MEVIAVVNQKGGVGKSSTALALVGGLVLRKKHVLAIDLDAQGNLSYTMGAQPGHTILEVLTKTCLAADAIQHTRMGDVIPANKTLSRANAWKEESGKEYWLKESLAAIGDAYDFVIVDSPPALGILTINALTAAQRVIIPAQADIYSVQGIQQLAETIQVVRHYCNPDLVIDGILLTRYNARSVLSREIAELLEKLAAQLETRLYRSTIREGIAVKEAQISRKNLFTYAPKANVTEDYHDFLLEVFGKPKAEKRWSWKRFLKK